MSGIFLYFEIHIDDKIDDEHGMGKWTRAADDSRGRGFHANRGTGTMPLRMSWLGRRLGGSVWLGTGCLPRTLQQRG